MNHIKHLTCQNNIHINNYNQNWKATVKNTNTTLAQDCHGK